jgi:hypothetical protein
VYGVDHGLEIGIKRRQQGGWRPGERLGGEAAKVGLKNHGLDLADVAVLNGPGRDCAASSVPPKVWTTLAFVMVVGSPLAMLKAESIALVGRICRTDATMALPGRLMPAA